MTRMPTRSTLQVENGSTATAEVAKTDFGFGLMNKNSQLGVLLCS